MNNSTLKALIEYNIQETIEYAEFLETAIVRRLTPIGLDECQKLQFFNYGYKVAMESMLEWIKEEEGDYNAETKLDNRSASNNGASFTSHDGTELTDP